MFTSEPHAPDPAHKELNQFSLQTPCSWKNLKAGWANAFIPHRKQQMPNVWFRITSVRRVQRTARNEESPGHLWPFWCSWRINQDGWGGDVNNGFFQVASKWCWRWRSEAQLLLTNIHVFWDHLRETFMDKLRLRSQSFCYFSFFWCKLTAEIKKRTCMWSVWSCLMLNLCANCVVNPPIHVHSTKTNQFFNRITE